MKSYRFLLCCCTCIVTLITATGIAQTTGGGNASDIRTADVPRVMSYQGLMRSIDGQSIADGLHSFQITFYADNGGATLVWTDEYSAATENGIFNLLLGSGTKSLPPGAAMSRPLWVGVRVDGGEEMKPLSQLVATPYALNVADNAITSQKLQDGAVTMDKMGTNYVGAIAVNGKPITSKGSVVNLTGDDHTSVTFDEFSNSIVVSATGAETRDNGDLGNGSASTGKNGGEQTQANGSAVKEGSAGGTVSYLTLWQSIGANSTIASKITDSPILDDGTSIIVNSTAGGSTAKLTITEASGNLTTQGSINTNSTGAAGGYYRIGNTLMLHNFGTNNIFVGASSGNRTMTGSSNTGVGRNTMPSLNNGFIDAAFGESAMASITDGFANTGIGSSAMFLTTDGDFNTAVGEQAFENNVHASGCTAVGALALDATTANGNTGVGYSALYTNGSGTNNTALGDQADVTTGSLTNATAIGYNAKVSSSNNIQLGNTSVTMVNTSGGITASGAITAGNGLTVSASGASITGTTSVTGATTLTGTTSVNTSGTSATSIGNSGSTTTVVGTTNVNTSGTAATTIGNTGTGASSTTINIGTTGNLTLGGIPSATPTLFMGLDGSNHVVATSVSPGGVTDVNGSSTITSTHGATPTISVTPGASNNTFMITSGGAVSFATFNAGSTLTGNGVGTGLDIDLTHANTWSGTQTFALTSAQGDAFVNSMNNATGAINYSRIQNGAKNTFLTTDNSGTVGYTTLNVDLTSLLGNGANNAVQINVDNANTWTNALSIIPGASHNVTSLYVEQTANGTPTNDIITVANSGGTVPFLRVDVGGSTHINTGAGAVHSDGTGTLLISPVDMTTEVTNTLGIGNGGTGSSTAAGAVANLGAASLTATNNFTGSNTFVPTVTLGRNIIGPGAVVGTLAFKDGTTGTNTATITVATQTSGSNTYTIIDGAGNQNFVMTGAGTGVTQTIASPVTVNQDLQVGNNTGPVNGHLVCGGAYSTIALDAATNAVSVAGTANDVAGVVSVTVSGPPGPLPLTGAQIDIPVTAAYGGTVVAVLVTPLDATSANARPYAFLGVVGGVSTIVIGIAAPPAPNSTLNFSYHVIQVQ